MEINSYDLVLAGKRLKQARKAKGYTQEVLAEMIGISSKNMSCLERGTLRMSVSTLVSLCRMLSVSADYILFGNDENNCNNTATLLLSRLPKAKQIQAEKVLEAFVNAFEER